MFELVMGLLSPGFILGGIIKGGTLVVPDGVALPRDFYDMATLDGVTVIGLLKPPTHLFLNDSFSLLAADGISPGVMTIEKSATFINGVGVQTWERMTFNVGQGKALTIGNGPGQVFNPDHVITLGASTRVNVDGTFTMRSTNTEGGTQRRFGGTLAVGSTGVVRSEGQAFTDTAQVNIAQGGSMELRPSSGGPDIVVERGVLSAAPRPGST